MRRHGGEGAALLQAECIYLPVPARWPVGKRRDQPGCAVERAQVATGQLRELHTVLIADDHALVRDALKQLLRSMPHKLQLLEAEDGDTLAHAMQHQPLSLVLLDLRMPQMQEGARLGELARQFPAIPIVVISALSSPDIVRQTLRISSVHAFVAKGESVAQVRAAVEAALDGRKIDRAPDYHGACRDASGLTPRQLEIRSLMRRGLSNKIIASSLGIREGTVKNHITEIFRTLNASNRTQAAQFASDLV